MRKRKGHSTTGTAPQAERRRARRAAPRARSGVLCLEVSLEVCNQAGGIYQVLRSKAPAMIERWGNRYCMIGPYIAAKAGLEFEERRATGWAARAIESARAQGLAVRHGRWLVPGRPRVLLVEHELNAAELDREKYLIWEHHRLATPPGDWAIDAAVSFGRACTILVRAIEEAWRAGSPDAREEGEGGDEANVPTAIDVSSRRAAGEPGPSGDRRVLAQFHEWLGSLAIPELRRSGCGAAFTFTTHATLLGRYIASNEENFYDTLAQRNDAHEAQRYNVAAHHAIERTCAHAAHSFTTVSSITGEECAQLLGRAPDAVTPNGLNIERYNVGHEFQTMHAVYKERIHRFVMGHFFPSYSFDLDRTLYFFTSGRFEPRNKGFDLCLEAMARLNAQLKDFGLPVNVVFFIVSQRPTVSILPRVLHQRGVLNELQRVCEEVMAEVGRKLFSKSARGQRVHLDEEVDQYWSLRLRRTQQALRSGELPPVVTHVVRDEGSDPVLNQIRRLGLFNRAEDPVKVVYHPEFINTVSPLWGIEYEQFVRGCHLGVFPSAYEPWGYTPLECIALGVPAITSDLAGFGKWVMERHPTHDDWGLTILKRRGRSFHEAAANLTRWLLAYCRLDRRGRIDMRNQVERHSWDFDWSTLVHAYHQVHDLALERAQG